MKNRLWLVAAVAVLSLAGAAVAVAGTGKKAVKATSTTTLPARTPETPLTGDTATQAKAAAVASAGAGSTADLATTENDSTIAGAAYEVHVTKADGTHARVILDKTYTVLAVDTAPPGGPGPRGNHP